MLKKAWANRVNSYTLYMSRLKDFDHGKSVKGAITIYEVIVLDPPLLFKKKMNTSAMILVPQLSRECVGSRHSSPVESQYQKKKKK